MKYSFSLPTQPSASSARPTAAQIQARFREGLALHNGQQLAQANDVYCEVLKLDSNHFDALHMLGVLLVQTNHLAQARQYISKAIEVNPDAASAHSNLGNVLSALRDYESAVASYDRAIRLKADHLNAHFNRGIALQELKQYVACIASYEKVIALRPDHADAYANRGVALNDMGRHDEAVASFDQALAMQPAHAMAWSNRGVALNDLKRYRLAIESCDKAIAIDPAFANAHCNRGVALNHLKQHRASVESHDRAIAVNPQHAQAYCNRGVAFGELKDYQSAILSYDRAIAIDSKFAAAYANRGNMLFEIACYQDAVDSYCQALAIQPDRDFIFGLMLHAKMRICDWRDFDSQLAELERRVELGQKATTPFSFLALSSSPALQLKVAKAWVKEQYPPNGELGSISKLPKKNRIRIGYFSMDFKNHPVSFLTAGLFEIHDRSRFEIIAFSYGSEASDEMRLRLESAFDKFLDVKDKSDREIAEMAREMQIDIAIDLAGLTGLCRTGIFALRAAPLQVSYLGYPGTMGAEYIDYLIADRQLIPEEAERHYLEKIVYLPSFQVNDSKRMISDRSFSRAELGLPPTGFVFCCFNNSYKITHKTFAGWMRILQQVEGSVLWLSGSNPAAVENLRNQAMSEGVDAKRLIFAAKLPHLADHLARHRTADLFLDTLPFNAHTTASDALWAGLPVLTLCGDALAGRVANSLLSAMDLPELVTCSQAEYETLAVELATNPVRLSAVRRKLEQNRLTTPLFDTKAFTHHIEDALTEMYERYHADLVPGNIYITH